MKWTLFHNPKCSKSRQALTQLNEQGIEPVIRLYLKDPLSKIELIELLGLLNLRPSEVLRSKEKIIQTQEIDLSSESKIQSALVAHPILIERPIISNGKKAVIGRPTENIGKLL